MVKSKLSALLLAGVIYLTAALPVWAVDAYGKPYPSELSPALVDPATAPAESLALLEGVSQQPSLGITVPKLDTRAIHCTRALTHEKKELKAHGYTDAQIVQMDVGDYDNLWVTWPMSADRQQFVKSFNNELADVDISGWTNGDYEAWQWEQSVNSYLPTEEQMAQFAVRDIMLDDARTLCKDFHSYENVLAQTDETLKEHLEGYYQFEINMVLYWAELEAAEPLVLPTFPDGAAACPVVDTDGRVIATARAVDGVTYLPMRTILEACGTTVDWHPDSKAIWAHTYDRNTQLRIYLRDQYGELSRDEQDVVLPELPTCYTEADTIYLPVRFIAETFLYNVHWDGAQVILELPR